MIFCIHLVSSLDKQWSGIYLQVFVLMLSSFLVSSHFIGSIFKAFAPLFVNVGANTSKIIVYVETKLWPLFTGFGTFVVSVSSLTCECDVKIAKM